MILYASTNGTGGGLNYLNPCSIATAMATTSLLGDLTIMCLTGQYPPVDVSRASTTLRSAPGNWARFVTSDVNTYPIRISANNVVVEWVGTQCTNTTRWWDTGGGRVGSIAAYVFSPAEPINVHIRNCVFLDGGDGIEHWSSAYGSMYGNIVLDNGWDDLIRGHGHGTYTQNLPSSQNKIIRHNVFAHMYSTGIKTGTNSSYVDHYRITENIVINPNIHSIYSDGGIAFNLYAYDHGSNDNVFSGNVTWKGGWVNNGVDSPNVHNNVTIINNWIHGGFGISMSNDRLSNINVTGNTVWTTDSNVVHAGNGLGTIDNNSYYGNKSVDGVGNIYTGYGFRLGPNPVTFTNWKAQTVYDDNSTHSPTGIPSARSWVFPNEYEAGRANLTVFNPLLQETVNVDCSSVIESGEEWWLYNSLNPYLGPIANGIGPTVTVPMTIGVVGENRTPAGIDPAPSSLPEFGSFIIRTQASSWTAPGTIHVPSTKVKVGSKYLSVGGKFVKIT